MSYDPYSFDRNYTQGIESLSQYTTKTFLWMFLGLAVTFAVSLALVVTNAVFLVFAIPGIQFILLIAELFVVIRLASRVQQLSVSAARNLFLVYSVLNGVVFSTLFFAYRLSTILLAFGSAAIYFGVLAVYGYVTKSDLSRLRPILSVGLVVMLVFWVASLFFNLSGMEQMMCLLGIALFLGLTAYDAQMIRRYYSYYCGYPDMLEKASIFSALQLYLDFINLFLYLLRFFARNQND